MCFSINKILISAEGHYKWTIYSIFQPKSICQTLVRFTCYILHPALSSSFDHMTNIVTSANQLLLTFQTKSVLHFLVPQRTKYKYIFWNYSELLLSFIYFKIIRTNFLYCRIFVSYTRPSANVDIKIIFVNIKRFKLIIVFILTYPCTNTPYTYKKNQ